MFIRKRTILSSILIACMAFMTANPAAWAAQAKPASANTMKLGFVNADMNEFADRMSEILGLTPMLVDSAVQGSIDFNITIPRDEVFDLFNVILKSKNAALVRQNNIYQIVPVALAIRNNLELIDELPPDAEPSSEISPYRPAPERERGPEDARRIPIATHVIRLDFVPVEEILEAVRLFVSDAVPIITFKRQNLMIVTDYPDNIERIKELVWMLDSSFLNTDLVDLIKIDNSNAVDIAAELKIIFGSSAVDNATTGVSFVALERLNAIFVMAGSRRALDEAKRWIQELDTYDGSKFQTYTYIVQESTASNIAMQLSALYSDDGTGSGSSSTSGGRNTQSSSSSSSSLLNQALSSYADGGSFGSAASLGPRLSTSASTVTSVILRGGEFSSLRDVARVVVDEINNVLHIQSTLADYRVLMSAIERMDTAPRQVLISAEIYQIDLTNELTYGFSGALEALNEAGNMTTAGWKDVGTLAIETFAGVGDSRQIRLAIEMLKTKTNVKILEHPAVLAMDGMPASFVSGAEVPYPTGIYTTNNGSTTGIDYRDTGVNLQVVPKISASGSVTLDILQEVSSVSTQNVGDTTAPTFPKSSVQTTFSVKDGQTVAIAGLIHDTSSLLRGGIPFLSDIPFIGGLFGGTNNRKNRTELVILITPQVIKTQDRFQEVTRGLLDSLRNVRKLADEQDDKRIRDIEDARLDREKKELSRIKEIKK